jgi:hypothetical protein
VHEKVLTALHVVVPFGSTHEPSVQLADLLQHLVPGLRGWPTVSQRSVQLQVPCCSTISQIPPAGTGIVNVKPGCPSEEASVVVVVVVVVACVVLVTRIIVVVTVVVVAR